MKTESRLEFVKLATTTSGPMAKIVAASIEVENVFPSLLTANLKAAGYAINYKPGTDHGSWVQVSADSATEYDKNNPNVVAQAFSHDAPDALLQAIYAEVKEEARVLDCAQKLSQNPEFMSSAEATDVELLTRLAMCSKNPELLTRELLVSIATDKSLMAAMAAL